MGASYLKNIIAPIFFKCILCCSVYKCTHRLNNSIIKSMDAPMSIYGQDLGLGGNDYMQLWKSVIVFFYLRLIYLHVMQDTNILGTGQ